MNNPVGWFEIYVKDMAQARQFYERVFGVELTAISSPSGVEIWQFPAQMNTYGATGGLVCMDGVEPGNNNVVVYFSCPDCQVTAEQAVVCGGAVVKEKFSIGENGFIALVSDNEGTIIGLHSFK